MKVSEKIDRQGARTPADIEQKYNFGKSFAEVMGVAKDARTSAETAQKSVTELDEKLTADEIFARLTKDGIFQGIFKDEDGKYYINAEVLKAVDSLFSKDITLTGTLTYNAKVFFEPDGQVAETIREHIFGRVPIADEAIKYFDFNNDGVVDGIDAAWAELARLGRKSLSDWAGEEMKTDATLTIDLKNPSKLIRVTGKNIWGRDIDKYVGVNTTNITNPETEARIGDISLVYVTEEGFENDWRYRLWNNGIVECWGTFTFENVAITRAWGSLYITEFTDRFSFPKFPKVFTSAPFVQANISSASGYCGWLLKSDDVPADYYNVGTYDVVRPTAATAGSLTVDFYVMGQTTETV